MSQLTYVILPGLDYTSTGPLWIDKIEISAKINNKSVTLYPIDNTGVINRSSPSSSIVFTKSQFQDHVNKISEGVYQHQIRHPKFVVGSTVIKNIKDSPFCGLVAVLHNGQVSNTVLFTINLYTNIDWHSFGGEYIANSGSTNYVLIDTLSIKYNPFVKVTQPLTIAATSSERLMQQQFTLKLDNYTTDHVFNTNSNFNIGSPIILSSDYFPKVSVLDADGYALLRKECSENWVDVVKANISVPSGSSFRFLPFDNSKDRLDKTSLFRFCSCILSGNGTSGKQRFTAVTWHQNKFNPSIKASYQIPYDFTWLSDTKYFTNDTININIQAEHKSSTSSFTQPTDAITEDTQNIYLNVGSSVQHLLNDFNSGYFTKALFKCKSFVEGATDIVYYYDDANSKTIVPVITTPTVSWGAVKATQGISSTSQSLVGRLQIDVNCEGISDLSYMSFIDNSSDSRGLDKLIMDTESPVNSTDKKKNIKIRNVSSSISASHNVTYSVQIDRTNIGGEFAITPHFSISATDKNSQSVYTLVLGDVVGSKVIDYDASVPTNLLSDYLNTHWASNKTAAKFSSYTVEENSMTKLGFTFDDTVVIDLNDTEIVSKVVSGETYLFKYQVIYEDKTGKLQFPQANVEDQAYIIEHEGGQWKIVSANLQGGTSISIQLDKNHYQKMYVGCIGLFKLNKSNITNNTDVSILGIPHCISPYEEVTLFSNNSKINTQYKCVYFPPDYYICAALYKITTDTDINTEPENFHMLYNWEAKSAYIAANINGVTYKT